MPPDWDRHPCLAVLAPALLSDSQVAAGGERRRRAAGTAVDLGPAAHAHHATQGARDTGAHRAGRVVRQRGVRGRGGGNAAAGVRTSRANNPRRRHR
eukprot:3542030-Prymnesium_polylepis.2